MKTAFRVNDATDAWHVWRVVRTFIVVNIGWYFDRIYNFGDCLQAFHNTLFNFNAAAFMPTLSALQGSDGYVTFGFAAIGCVIVLVVSILRERGVDVAGSFLRKNVVVRFACYGIIGLLVVASFAYAPTAGGFIYANF